MRYARATRMILLSSMLFAWFAAFTPAALAQQSFPCFLKSECLRGPVENAAGDCSANYCFELGGGTCSVPQGLCYARSAPISLTVPIGGVVKVQDIGDYVNTVYQFGLSIAGVVAAVTMVIGGWQYMTGHAAEGKERIKNSLIGVVLVFGAYIILLTISPDLVKLQLPKVPVIKKQVLVQCAVTESCAPCGVEYSVLERLKDKATATVTSKETCKEFTIPKGGTFDSNNYGVLSSCVGKGCGADTMKGGTPACSSGTHRCAAVPTGTPFACGTAPSGAVDGFACQKCTQPGGTCTKEGVDDSCCGGFCSGGTCTSGEPGSSCNDKKQCKSGICETDWMSACSTGEVGATRLRGTLW